MPRLPLLILHEIFPSFPPLWEFLLAGLVIGGAITAIVSRQRRPRIDSLSRLERSAHVRSHATHSPALKPSSARRGMGGEILGVPWSIPAYCLLLVLVGAALSLKVPIASFIITPGFVFMFIVLFNSSALQNGPEFIAYLLIGVGSWAFWTLCAGTIWRVVQRLNGASPPSGPTRLNLGKKQADDLVALDPTNSGSPK